MRAALDNPFLVLLGSLIVFSASAWSGTKLHRVLRIGESDGENFSFVLGESCSTRSRMASTSGESMRRPGDCSGRCGPSSPSMRRVSPRPSQP